METKETKSVTPIFERFALSMTRLTGKPGTFLMAFAVILVWGITGPFFKFSDTWQLVINTGTTIITFLMVFIIQQSQNKDSLSIQLKLNEIVAAMEGASNRLINVENLSENDLIILGTYYRTLSEMAKKEDSLNKSHSIEEATLKHEIKHR
ncbi:MAG TPA: low affinity iron permease family protein, partial [Cytophagaceae bacterium]|nr:low affinity iron permease family protein [Cytophagaceae bacterium]